VLGEDGQEGGDWGRSGRVGVRAAILRSIESGAWNGL